MAYGSFVLMRDLNFVVRRGDIFVIMGGSGCGKSTLLTPPDWTERSRHRVKSFTAMMNFTRAHPRSANGCCAASGCSIRSGALWSSMTLAENVGLPLGEFTDLSPTQIREIAALKLALVGLKGFEDFYPNEISGGMQKRAGLARAMALGPGNSLFR